MGGTGPGQSRPRGAPPARVQGGRALLCPASRSASEPPGPREARPEAPGEGRAEAPADQKNDEAAPGRPGPPSARPRAAAHLLKSRISLRRAGVDMIAAERPAAAPPPAQTTRNGVSLRAGRGRPTSRGRAGRERSARHAPLLCGAARCAAWDGTAAGRNAEPAALSAAREPPRPAARTSHCAASCC